MYLNTRDARLLHSTEMYLRMGFYNLQESICKNQFAIVQYVGFKCRLEIVVVLKPRPGFISFAMILILGQRYF